MTPRLGAIHFTLLVETGQDESTERQLQGQRNPARPKISNVLLIIASESPNTVWPESVERLQYMSKEKRALIEARLAQERPNRTLFVRNLDVRKVGLRWKDRRVLG